MIFFDLLSSTDIFRETWNIRPIAHGHFSIFNDHPSYSDELFFNVTLRNHVRTETEEAGTFPSSLARSVFPILYARSLSRSRRFQRLIKNLKRVLDRVRYL